MRGASPRGCRLKRITLIGGFRSAGSTPASRPATAELAHRGASRIGKLVLVAPTSDLYKINVNFVPLDPDIPAPLTLDAYLAGRDPALEAVAADIRRRAAR